MRLHVVCVGAVVALAAGICGAADKWPQWRGADARGIAKEESIATHWSDTENVIWRAPLPGQGGATPVFWEDRIFVTSADGDDLVLICLNTDGDELWRRQVASGNRLARAGEGNSASASPATDGEHVWAFFSCGDQFRKGILACYDFAGQERWKFDLADRFGEIDIQFGLTSTPVLDGDSLYLQMIHGPMVRGNDVRTGKIARINKLTGATIWEVDRETEAGFECKHSYASPFLYDDGERRFLVAHGANCTTGHSLETGEELWRIDGLNGPTDLNPRNYDPTFRFVASPAVGDGVIIIPTCKRGPTLAVSVEGSGLAKVRWRLPETPDVSIPLIVGDLVYLLHKDGRLQCVELETGKPVYFERTYTKQHRSSPVFADGHIYFCATDGVCTVVRAGRDFEIVAENAMGGEPITASPVVVGGRLYLRTYEALYAIGE